ITVSEYTYGSQFDWTYNQAMLEQCCLNKTTGAPFLAVQSCTYDGTAHTAHTGYDTSCGDSTHICTACPNYPQQNANYCTTYAQYYGKTTDGLNDNVYYRCHDFGTSCFTNGDWCDQNANCCSGICSNGGCVSCVYNGSSCSS